MWIFGKSLDEISHEDLGALIVNRVRESSTLEFKRDMAALFHGAAAARH